MKAWFLLRQGQVLGPFTPEEVEAQIPQCLDPLIWGKGLSEWMAPDKWRKSLREASLYPEVRTSTQTEATDWHYRIEGVEKPPVTFSQLLQFLRDQKDYSYIDVKSDRHRSWKDVYAVAAIVEALGISRRSAPRVPILGTLDCETEKGPRTLRALSISEGGMGVGDAEGLNIGEKLRIQLKSPNLFQPISATCEVVYAGKEGYAGLKFSVLPLESHSLIIEYVKKFDTED